MNGDGAISFAEFSDGLLNHGSMAAHSGAEIGVHSPAKPAAEPEAGSAGRCGEDESLKPVGGGMRRPRRWRGGRRHTPQ